MEVSIQESKGFYKLSWVQRIGFASGDLAQNLIYQVVTSYLLFYYTDVFKLGGDKANAASIAGTMMLIVRLVDVVWDPIVGTIVDKNHPRWGKYRSYLILGGIPLTILAIFCFWDGFKSSIIYAYITYVGLSLCYTLVNVPYGALNSSLTRDTDEITILTSTRMLLANVGGFIVGAGIPVYTAILSGGKIPVQFALFQALGSLPSFIFMPLVPVIKRIVGKKNMFYIFLVVAIVGYLMMYVVSKMGVNKYIVLMYVAQFIKSSGVCVSTGYMWALIPEVVSFGEYNNGRRIAGIVNALTGIFFKAGYALGGAIPGWVIGWTHYKAPEKEASTLPKDSKAWFIAMLTYAILGFVLLVFCFTQTKERVVMDEKETKNVKISDLWVEFIRNRPLRVVALFFITAFAMMAVGNTGGAYLMNDLHLQVKSAQEGVRWSACIIPSIVAVIAIIIISRYELTDEKIDKINAEIEEKNMKLEEEEAKA